MAVSFVVLALLISLAAAVEKGCIWTDTNCACSKKKDIVGSQTCWDPIAPIVPAGQNQPCTGRQCKLDGKNIPYVCDCNGPSYCEFKSINRISLMPISPGMCSSKNIVAKSIALVEEDIKKVHGLTSRTGNCLFTDNECTCAAPSEKRDCIDFKAKVPQYGNTCTVRDCQDSMVCDCGGNTTCSKKTVTKMVWKSTGNVPGQPGLVTCKHEEATFVQVTPKVLSQKQEGTRDSMSISRRDAYYSST